MDEQLKKEKEELKKALESLSGGETDKGLEVLKKDLQADFAQKQKKWEEKRKKYHKEIDELKKRLQEKDDELKTSLDTIRKESDSVLFEERRKADKMAAKFQEDHDKVRDELNGEISRLKADYDEKIEDYEQRLDKALADKVEKMVGNSLYVFISFALSLCVTLLFFFVSLPCGRRWRWSTPRRWTSCGPCTERR